MFFNPNMMGNNGFNLPKLPTVKELWKNEKTQYRHWVILFAIALVAIIALSITAFTLNFLGMGDWIKKDIYYLDENQNRVPYTDKEKRGAFIYSYLAPEGLRIAFLVVALGFFIFSIVEVYKKQNFAKLSSFVTFAFGLAAFMSAWDLIQIAFSKGSISGYATETAGGIFSIAFSIVAILAWGLISAPLARIRRMFAMSERVEQLQKDPQWQQAKAQFDAMMQAAQGMQGPFGPAAGAAQAQPMPQTDGEQTSETVTPATPEVSPERKRLEGLSLAQLKKVAAELSISGASSMKKDELIEAILRVTQGDK